MCFTLDWFMHLLIWLVIVCAVIAILRIFVPWVLAKLSPGPQVADAIAMVGRIINIVIWAVIIIFAIYVVFALMSMGGGFSLLPHR
jgi:hypothetical protein